MSPIYTGVTGDSCMYVNLCSPIPPMSCFFAELYYVSNGKAMIMILNENDKGIEPIKQYHTILHKANFREANYISHVFGAL